MRKKRGKTVRIILTGTLIVLAVNVFFLASHFNLLPQKSYTAADFNIETITSDVDFNENGIDDYTDILLGARKDAQNKPKYDGAYQQGGYPPNDIGVCSDVVWRAFKNAGYNLRDMVDADIQNRRDAYPRIEKPDTNIDFRRVRNLRIFFEKYAVSLTQDIHETDQWQPGDIVIFGNDKHIGIVSDKRNKDGHTYIIHNGGQPNREEDYLKRGTVTGHYRFDAALIDMEELIPW
ncbi:MAG: DUF1287 domain-containing protein [Lachnospiraceae bacterium]|nr:DUF1287 domain-containing protein [Lachnospiraceae bacterium]